MAQKVDKLVALFNGGRYPEAEQLAEKLAKRTPSNGFVWKVLAAALAMQGRTVDSLAPMRRAAGLLPKDVEAHSNLGTVLKDLGRLDEAEASYRRSLAIKPDYAVAHSNLGTVLKELGRLDEAEAGYRRSLEIKPDYAMAHSNLGTVLKELGRLDEAEASFRSSLAIKPDYAEAHSNLGVVLKELGRLDEAETSHRNSLAIKPDYAEAHGNLGVVLKELGRLDEAEASYRRSLEIKPDYAEAHGNLGTVLKELGRLGEAEASYRRSLEIKPDYAEAHNNRGNVLKDLGLLDGAEASYRKSLEIMPDYAVAHYNLAIVLNDLGRLDEAEASYRRSLAIKPDCAEAHGNLGTLLKELGRLDEAEASYRRSLEVKPDYAVAHSNLGTLLKELGRLDEAEASYRRSLAINPDYAEVHSNLLFTLLNIPGHTLSDYLEEARKYGQMVAKKAASRFSDWHCAPSPDRLRVGLVSGDLRNHPVGFFLESVLDRIAPSRIELIAYSTNNMVDELTARIKPHFFAWKSLADLSDEAAADLIHTDGVHLLLDLSGHTAKNRLPIFAWKPAPVQATWLGYSSTTGVAEMDYLLGDPHVTPVGEEDHFTETIWKLPESYLCLTPPPLSPEVGSLPASLSDRITFGSFNNLTKMNDGVVALWARVLQAVVGSRLFLKTKQLNDSTVCETTRQRFAARGIPADRLILGGTSATRVELLEAYNRVDIALDPFPYTGTTTSVESLWMGVPVITRRGDRFLSHVGESILNNAGLADWIAEDDDDYVAKAVLHTQCLSRLAALRAGLREQVASSPLFDAERFARHLEAALWGMWDRRRNGQNVDISPP